MKSMKYKTRNDDFIITRAPMRITLAGGGTDVTWYSKIHGGRWISAAIDKYVYVNIKKNVDSKILIVNDVKYKNIDKSSNEFEKVIFACLKMAGISRGLEIVIDSDIPPSSGLGGSGALEVGLLYALHKYKKINISKYNLAEKAAKIEIDILKKPVGPQDQFIAAYGGIRNFSVNKRGKVNVFDLVLKDAVIKTLEQNLLFFATGIVKDTNKILGSIRKRSMSNREKLNQFDLFNNIKQIGLKIRQALLTGDVDKVGHYFHQHWLLKKRLSNQISNKLIDQWYNEALKNGAQGGKIMGAGGGGWFVFYVNKKHSIFINKLEKSGLKHENMKFDWEGVKCL